MTIAIIVAMSENRVIGRANGLPWHLSTDLRRFKRLTTGHTYIVGRRTFESVGRALPGRRNIVVTHDPAFHRSDVEVAHSIQDALALAPPGEEVFIGGGGEIFRQTVDLWDRAYITLVHTRIEGDTYFPEIDWSKWREVSRESHPADAKNDYDFTFIDYER